MISKEIHILEKKLAFINGFMIGGIVSSIIASIILIWI